MATQGSELQNERGREGVNDPRTLRADSVAPPRFVLGVDLDGVCADFYGGLRPLAATWFGVDDSTLSADFSYGLSEWGFESVEKYEEFHRWAVSERGLFEELKPVRAAPTTLRRLSDAEIHIRIITNRLFVHRLHKEAVRQTVEWLDCHAIPYRDLCLVADKTAVGADLYVDDAPSNLRALSEAGLHAIVFSNPTNSHVHELPRADTWEDLERLALEGSQPWWAEYNERAKTMAGR